jgi:cholest-4-en-3-one 26-monooxygenase
MCAVPPSSGTPSSPAPIRAPPNVRPTHEGAWRLADLADIDLLDRDRFTQGIPHEWFTRLRAEAPVYHHPEPDGPGFWVITKHDDIIQCNRDAATFSSEQARGGVVGLEEQTNMQTEAEAAGGRMMLMMDPPDHTRYRKLVNRGFTPRMIGEMETHIRALTNTILDEAIAKDESDFVVDVAAELPLEVIAELIGVPSEDRHKIFDWSNRMVGSEDPEYIVSEEEIFNAQVEMFMYAQQLADSRRKEPRDDIITALLSAEVDGESLSDMDFNLFFLLLSVAGNETTRNAISHGMNAFL